MQNNEFWNRNINLDKWIIKRAPIRSDIDWGNMRFTGKSKLCRRALVNISIGLITLIGVNGIIIIDAIIPH